MCARTVNLAVWVFLLLGVLNSTVVARPPTSADSGTVLTTVSDVKHQSKPGQSVLCALRLEGDVLWASPDRDQFILQDRTGGIRVKMDGRSEPPLQTGEQIVLFGKGLVDAGGLREALIDNDGVHPAIEKSGEVYLTAGLHPIRLDWFNALLQFDLQVSFQGPDQPRQAIPGHVFFRAEGDDGANIKWTNGLSYRCYEGSWDNIPDFKSLDFVKTGTTTNFDLSVLPRDTNVGIQFTGAINLPRNGLYTFWDKSDDGSRLFIGDSFLSVQPTGLTNLPMPRPIYPGQPLSLNEDCQWSTITGVVTFVSAWSNSFDVEINSGTGSMFLHVAAPADGYSRLLPNSRIRATGVSQSVFNSNGQRIDGTLLVPGLKQMEIIEPASSLWTAIPISPIKVLLHSSAFGESGALVHIRGRVKSVASDKSFLVMDASGEMTVKTDRLLSDINRNSEIEALGQWTRHAAGITLAPACIHLLHQDAGSATNLPTLTTIEQVKSLPREEAGKGYPVKVRGIVTAPIYDGFFLQDGKWAIFVRWNPPALRDTPRTGDYWEVEGDTYADFAPNIQANHAARLGPGIMPDPLHPTPDQFVNGSLDTRYVEIQGIVTVVESDGLQMLTPIGRIRVQLSDIDPALRPANGDLKQYENALVRVRGCAIPGRNYKTQQVQPGNFWIWLYNYTITVDQPPPPDPFSAPVKSVAELRLFNPHASILERVKVFGQILHSEGEVFFLWDGTNGLRFIPEKPINMPVGDQVEVLGFPDLSGPFLVLREAIVKRTGHAPLPEPSQLSPKLLLNREYDGSLVRVQARLTDISTESSDKIMTLQAGSHGFIARLNNREPLRNVLPGSRVELTGVYASLGDVSADNQSAAPFELLLNSQSGIQVLEYPSWWTLRRLLAVLGVILLILTGALLWIFTLKRQVNTQALMIHQKVEREAILEERARIARDIHDSLEQALAGTSLQLNALADSLHEVSPEPRRILKVARSMIKHAQDEARRTVRNLRLLNLEKSNLPAALSQFVVRMAAESQIKILVNVEGIYKTLPNQIEGHLLRVGQEAVTNAIKHAGAKNIVVTMKCGPERLELSVQDDGCGFNPDQAAGASAGHFGLLGMRERAEKMGGDFEVKSSLGRGTTIVVRMETLSKNRGSHDPKAFSTQPKPDEKRNSNIDCG